MCVIIFDRSVKSVKGRQLFLEQIKKINQLRMIRWKLRYALHPLKPSNLTGQYRVSRPTVLLACYARSLG